MKAIGRSETASSVETPTSAMCTKMGKAGAVTCSYVAPVLLV